MNAIPMRAALVVAATYGYFLLFAQFAFVELLRTDMARYQEHALSSPVLTEKIVLGAMAAVGILTGFFVAWKGASPCKIKVGLALGAVASLLAPLNHSFACFVMLAVLAGVGIGFATVSLAPLLRGWCGLLWVGLGTGLGYAVCNLPFVFTQSPANQSWIAAGFAIVGAIAVPGQRGAIGNSQSRIFPFYSALILFTALVWLDSAAFFVIQHASDLKSATWGDALLWRNAALHLVAAILAGLWLKKGAARLVPAVAWCLLAVAVIAVNQPAGRTVAGWLYPVAVSIYSVALVAWPAWFAGELNDRQIAWRAAWIYAVAGWFGSANGIGMVQSLQRIPPQFIAIAGICVLAAMASAHFERWRIWAVVGLVIAASRWPGKADDLAGSSYDRGKQVYLAEGCIHCHSQYVRSGTRDEEFWGPARDLRAGWSERPVLIGNRRQGPDLADVGARRSAAWLKLHFINPADFSPGTVMPSYAHLFDDGRGEDLVSYLKQSGADAIPALVKKSANWNPASATSSVDGAALFQQQCIHCHGAEGKGNGPLAGELAKPPANLANGPWIWSAGDDPMPAIERVIKFGISGTDMPGHETLTDPQIIGLAAFVRDLRRTAVE